jgi:hypothetical protein
MELGMRSTPFLKQNLIDSKNKYLNYQKLCRVPYRERKMAQYIALMEIVIH